MGDAVLKGVMEGLPRHLEVGGYCQIVTMLSEFDGISHEKEIEEFARSHGYETLILAGPEYLGAGVYVTPYIGGGVLADARLMHLAVPIETEDDLRTLVRVNIENGARVIKIPMPELALICEHAGLKPSIA